jgi:hypothetical protein
MTADIKCQDGIFYKEMKLDNRLVDYQDSSDGENDHLIFSDVHEI